MLLLAAAFVAASPGAANNGSFLPAAALLGLSLLPIGLALRLRWLASAALVCGVLLLALWWQAGGGRAASSPLASMVLVLASAAAATGQWRTLDRLTIGRFGGVLRGLSQIAIVASGLLLVGYFCQVGGVIGALLLALVTPVNLLLTTLTLICAALAARRTASGS